MQVEYQIGDQTIFLNLKGEVVQGEEKTLLQDDDNLLAHTPSGETGFIVAPFLTAKEFDSIYSGITSMVKALIRKVKGEIDDDFCLEHYHHYVTDSEHLQIAKLIQYGWNVSEFPIDFRKVEERISTIIGIDVTAEAHHLNPESFISGLYANDKKVQIFNLRIVRPQKLLDSNPPHRDVWIDRLRNAINIYCPICGSTAKSSLPLIPYSHHFKESEIERTSNGATLNGTSYSVPCVTLLQGKPPHLIRPNPKQNELLLFSPYLIHGGGYNFEEEVTRVSLEIRFWRSPDILQPK